MVRAPCCEKMGLKKGPWSDEEDQVLISHIQKFGHGNWRALPKQAGLLRCGKSCRLRWMNYLRPDIKRGNFTREEEDTIIHLHETLGNKWSAIAARLPGRTDNEIKNVWHTHLKKRLKENQQGITLDKKEKSPLVNKCNSRLYTGKHEKASQNSTSPTSIMSPQESSSGLSASSDVTNVIIKDEIIESSMKSFLEINESFWSDDAALADNSSMPKESQDILDYWSFRNAQYLQLSGGFPSTSIDASQLPNTVNAINVRDSGSCSSASMDEGMDFWFDILVNPDGLPELPDF